MNELIKIEINENNEQIVSGRELHKFLKVNTPYTQWIERKIEKYEFVENKDFVLHSQKCESSNVTGFKVLQDHLMKMTMAKEVAMTENNERGKLARIYFIQCEEAWNNDDMIMARALKIQQKKILGYSEKIELLENQIKEQAPSVLFAKAVSTSNTSILIGEQAKILKQNGYDTGEKRLFEWLRQNGYLISRKGTDWNMPTQKSMNLGLFEIKETVHQQPNGSVKITKTPKITGKGQQYFINKFLGDLNKFELRKTN